MTCSESLLYLSCRCFLNSSNSLLDSSVFLFSSSTSSMRAAILSCSPISCSWSVISADVSALVELLRIPAFFQKRFFLIAWEGGLALVEAEDLGNNINTSHWLLPISNMFCLHNFHCFLQNSISKTLGYSVYTKIWEEERGNSKLLGLCHQGID